MRQAVGASLPTREPSYVPSSRRRASRLDDPEPPRELYRDGMQDCKPAYRQTVARRSSQAPVRSRARSPRRPAKCLWRGQQRTRMFRWPTQPQRRQCNRAGPVGSSKCSAVGRSGRRLVRPRVRPSLANSKSFAQPGRGSRTLALDATLPGACLTSLSTIRGRGPPERKSTQHARSDRTDDDHNRNETAHRQQRQPNQPCIVWGIAHPGPWSLRPEVAGRGPCATKLSFATKGGRRLVLIVGARCSGRRRRREREREDREDGDHEGAVRSGSCRRSFRDDDGPIPGRCRAGTWPGPHPGA